MSFAQKVTSIKGMEARRMPRLGKIRLGLKVKNKNAKPCDCISGCFKCTHPVETPYFVVPTEVARYCGEKPAELDIIVPLEDLETVFPRSYKWYGSSRGLKCSGNLEKAYRLDEKTLQRVEIQCPCSMKDKECNPSGSLQVILPKVNFGGVYQITTGSWNSMTDIVSGLEFVRCLLGRYSMVPLKLRRVPTETHHGGKKQVHYPIQVILDTNSIEFINALKEQTNKVLEAPRPQLAPPEEIRPDLDGGVVEEEEDNKQGQAGQQLDPPVMQQINEEQKKVITDALRKKNLCLDFLEGYMDRKLADFRGVEDLNSALEWIRKQPKA